MVSVLIPTLNEERNISDCIASVQWADEIVVVDSGSKDRTQALARGLGAKVVEFGWNGRLPKKKNWALENVEWKNEWVLILDADERVDSALSGEIESAVRQSGTAGYFINRRFLFMGKWVRHCGYYPSWNLRLFRHELGRYERLIDGDSNSGDNEVHEHVILNGSSGYLLNELIHLAYPDIFTWMEKHNRYSNWEAEMQVGDPRFAACHIGAKLWRKRWLRNFSRRLPFRPALRFLYSYLFRFGFLDGYEGYVLCRLLATYEMLSVFKSRELERSPRGNRTSQVESRTASRRGETKS